MPKKKKKRLEFINVERRTPFSLNHLTKEGKEDSEGKALRWDNRDWETKVR